MSPEVPGSFSAAQPKDRVPTVHFNLSLHLGILRPWADNAITRGQPTHCTEELPRGHRRAGHEFSFLCLAWTLALPPFLLFLGQSCRTRPIPILRDTHSCQVPWKNNRNQLSYNKVLNWWTVQITRSLVFKALDSIHHHRRYRTGHGGHVMWGWKRRMERGKKREDIL